jgi:hypothetical protein
MCVSPCSVLFVPPSPSLACACVRACVCVCVCVCACVYCLSPRHVLFVPVCLLLAPVAGALSCAVFCPDINRLLFVVQPHAEQDELPPEPSSIRQPRCVCVFFVALCGFCVLCVFFCSLCVCVCVMEVDENVPRTEAELSQHRANHMAAYNEAVMLLQSKQYARGLLVACQVFEHAQWMPL